MTGASGSTPRAGLLLSDLNEYLDRMKHHGRRRLKIRDTIVYECQRLAGRLLRGLDDDAEVDLSVFDLAAEMAAAVDPCVRGLGRPGGRQPRDGSVDIGRRWPGAGPRGRPARSMTR